MIIIIIIISSSSSSSTIITIITPAELLELGLLGLQQPLELGDPSFGLLRPEE